MPERGAGGAWFRAGSSCRRDRGAGPAAPISVPRVCGDSCVVAGDIAAAQAYVADLIWAAVVAKAAGAGYRPIGHRSGIPVCTVRGWLRVIDRRADGVRDWFLGIAVAAGVDVSIPKASGSGCGDVVAAVGAAREAIAARFGDRPVLGAVTAAHVAVTGSGARLLSPAWPLPPGEARATRTDPDC
jgi:hypothetical protein